MLAKAPTLSIAHRGASAYAPEHTFSAYDMALAQGADVLELDVRLTADGVPVVIHDRTLWRTALVRWPVGTTTLRGLEQLDPLIRPLRLDEVFDRYGRATRYLIDLKAPRVPLERQVLAEALRSGLEAQIQIQSFNRSAIGRVRQICPTVSTAQLYPRCLARRVVLQDIGATRPLVDTIGPHASCVDLALVRAAHAAGLRVQPYTVNDSREMRRLLDLGVDGIITDRPDLARTEIDAHGRDLRGPVAA